MACRDDEGPVPTVLVVEDDAPLAEMVCSFLEEEGYATTREARGDSAVERILRERPDAVLLDIRLPGMDGLSVCREVQGRYAGVVLMITARGDEVDEITGLELGADDYLSKPVRPRVLLARLRSALRRGKRHRNEPLRIGALEVNPARREARVDGRILNLSTAEFDLLCLLARRAGVPIDRDTLYRELTGAPYDGWDRAIDLRVSKLRKKLGDRAAAPDWIKSIRGVGYQLADPRD